MENTKNPKKKKSEFFAEVKKDKRAQDKIKLYEDCEPLDDDDIIAQQLQDDLLQQREKDKTAPR